MEHISKLLLKNNSNFSINVSNGISNNVNNDSNVNNYVGKYSLDKKKFIPRSEKTQLAEGIATILGDLSNYACYLNIVNKIGVAEAMRLRAEVLDDIKEKEKTKSPVRNRGSYFVWKYKKYFSK